MVFEICSSDLYTSLTFCKLLFYVIYYQCIAHYIHQFPQTSDVRNKKKQKHDSKLGEHFHNSKNLGLKTLI